MVFQRSKDGRFSGGPAKSPRKSPMKSPGPPPAKKRKTETPSSSKQTLQGGERDIAEGRKSRGRPRISLQCPKIPRTPGTDGKSPIKTRRILNSKKTNPHCTLCKKARKEELKTCGTCELSYHLSHCLRMAENLAEKTVEMDEWTCPKCIRCSMCEGIIDDCTNVECSVCQRAWHGTCFKGKNEGKDTVCKKCRGRGGTHSPVTPRTPSMSNTPASAPSSSWKKGRPSLPGGPRKLPKGYVMIPESVMHGGDVPSSNNPETEAIEEILNSRARVWDNLVEEFQKQQSLPNSPLKRDRSKSRSPEKKLPQQLPRLSLQKVSTHEDYDLFQSALRQLNQETGTSRKTTATNTTSIGKWVYFGDSPKMKALYASPYPEDVLAGGSIFVCPYCMHATCRIDTYRIHMQNCEFRHPPGNEIYREGSLSFFEVDGAAQRLYCRSLCLLSKMFISSKTLHHEVETFLFYILTDNTAQGCRMVAYFSKEKNPSKNNNLSCLLTLPGQNRKGYGKLLIDLSYELSRLEHKIGSPEHPLSDLGLFAYRGYWRASILQHLRSLHHSQSTSIKSIALATRINPSDVINQLLRDKLLAYVDGNYFIKTGKRAYKWPLSFFRRRVIDKSKLVWKPGNDVTDLDPSKINFYV